MKVIKFVLNIDKLHIISEKIEEDISIYNAIKNKIIDSMLLYSIIYPACFIYELFKNYQDIGGNLEKLYWK